MDGRWGGWVLVGGGGDTDTAGSDEGAEDELEGVELDERDSGVEVDKGHSIENAELGEGFECEAGRGERAMEIAEGVEAETGTKGDVVGDRAVRG